MVRSDLRKTSKHDCQHWQGGNEELGKVGNKISEPDAIRYGNCKYNEITVVEQQSLPKYNTPDKKSWVNHTV